MSSAPPTEEGASGSTCSRIDGTAHAKAIRASLKERVASFARPPSLHVVIVGERPDSQSYVRMKVKACTEAGIHSEVHSLPSTASEEEVCAVVDKLGKDDSVDGILVQLPLPAHCNEPKCLSFVPADKDVDGFDRVHMGDLALRGHEPRFVPCTAKGCIELLKREGVQIEGARAVVLGRSNIVGTPVALLLLNENATVTVAHSRTKDLAAVCREADIVIVAMGRRGIVTKDHIKPGAVVIDVGIHRVEDASKKSGYRMVGDVDYDDIAEVASKLTPVPGGVGPMTIAVLLSNTVDAYTAKAT